eukprot:Nitzschia sp. Nitz4//scaffold44_size153857//37896//39738//NITZ4_002707-RA/size153857-augustus-gene-0.16-mRNA-1//-1//CDS//3329552115//5036//frame0
MTTKEIMTMELAKAAGLAIDRLPQTEEEADIAEQALAKDFKTLNIDMHEKILLDVHGIPRSLDDHNTPEGIKQKLEELEAEIQKLDPADREGINLARGYNAEYVDNPKFRLHFLRAHKFDVQSAALRFANHFKAKLVLFGTGEILGREVTQADLSEADMAELDSGSLQLLPERDAVGRVVLCTNRSSGHNMTDFGSICRALFYFQMNVLNNVEMNDNGVVVVLYNYGVGGDSKLSENGSMLRMACPLRVDAIHYCYRDQALRPLVVGMQLFSKKSWRFRFIPHFGTPEDITFQLQTFGIPANLSPMTKEGVWLTDRYFEWVKAALRQEQEVRHSTPLSRSVSMDSEATTPLPKAVSPDHMSGSNHSSTSGTSSSKASVLVPGKHDVLFGRGKVAKQHVGNVRALTLCEQNYERYEAAVSKSAKTKVAEEVLQMIHSSGGRFLRPKGKKNEETWWEIVCDGDARDKISHFFRHMRFKTSKSNDTAAASPTTTQVTLDSTDRNSSTKRKTNYIMDDSHHDCMGIRNREDFIAFQPKGTTMNIMNIMNNGAPSSLVHHMSHHSSTSEHDWNEDCAALMDGLR